MKIEKDLALRKTEQADLGALFILQFDIESNYLAAFTPKDPTASGAASNPKCNTYLEIMCCHGNELQTLEL